MKKSDNEKAKSSMDKIIEIIRAVYKREEDLFEDAIKTEIRDLDAKIKTQISKLDVDKFRSLLNHRQRILISFPIKVIRLIKDNKSDEFHKNLCDDIDKNIDLIVKNYSNREELTSLARKIRINSTAADSPSSRAQYYLLGQSGVGKTHFVRELAKTLRLPLQEINLTEKNNFKKIDSSSMAIKHETLITSDIDEYDNIYGPIQMAIIKAGIKNLIILFDQTRSVLLEEQPDIIEKINTLFDRHKTSLSLGPFENVTLNFMHPIIIFIGTEKIPHESIRTRFSSINFPTFSVEERIEIINDSLLEKHVETKNTEKKQKIIEKAKKFVQEIRHQENSAERAGMSNAEHAVKDMITAIEYSVIREEEIDDGMIRQIIASVYQNQ